MQLSDTLANALAARWINQIFGTHYDGRTLGALEDAHIEELLTACKLIEEIEHPKQQVEADE